MNRSATHAIRVLAVDPTHRGFGFAVLESPDRLVDWGVKTVRGDKQAGCLRKIRELLQLYQPTVVILEDCARRGSRRCPRVRRLIERIRVLATKSGVKARVVSRAQVHKAFAPASTKHEIAVALAKHFPELALSLPPLRKPWMSEDCRMNVFDAVALALPSLPTQGKTTPF